MTQIKDAVVNLLDNTVTIWKYDNEKTDIVGVISDPQADHTTLTDKPVDEFFMSHMGTLSVHLAENEDDSALLETNVNACYVIVNEHKTLRIVPGSYYSADLLKRAFKDLDKTRKPEPKNPDVKLETAVKVYCGDVELRLSFDEAVRLRDKLNEAIVMIIKKEMDA